MRPPILLLAVLTCIPMCCDFAYLDYPGAPYYGSGDHEYGDDDYPRAERTEADPPTSNLINEWFGSESEAREKLWDRLHNPIDLTCQLDSAWAHQEAIAYLTGKESKLTKEEEKVVLAYLQTSLDNTLEEIGRLTYKNKNCSDLLFELNKTRSNLDCIMKPQRVTDLLAQIPSISGCWMFMEELWEEVQKRKHAGCSSEGAYQELVHVAQITKGRFTDPSWSTDREEMRLDLIADIVYTISTPSHYRFLQYTACPKPGSKCKKLSNCIEQTLCEPLTISIVNQIEALIRDGSKERPPRDGEEMNAMLEILTQLTDVLDVLKKDGFITRVSQRIAVDLLQNYMEIVDNTLQNSGDNAWNKMGRSTANKHLNVILVNNEKYVGVASDMILSASESNSTTVESDLITLRMKRASQVGTNQGKVGFEFSEVEIETDVSRNTSEDLLDVYAIHYKSWAEMLEGSGANGTSSNQSLPGKKIFVGKGGIVSLTAQLNMEKKSVPVSYKMKFGDRFAANHSGSAVRHHRCLSCEYLNPEKGIWEDTGCVVRSADEDGVTCHCNHTTNFAAFMSPVEITLNMTDFQYRVKETISYAGSTMSVLALAISLVIFITVRPNVQNDRLKAHINLAISLFFVHAIQLAVEFAVNNDVACIITTILTHFFLLASFFWMLTEGIFLYLYVVQVFVHSKSAYINWLFVTGWVIPALIVALSAGIGIPKNLYLDVKEATSYCDEGQILYPPLPRQTDSSFERCWLSTRTGMSWSFIGPAAIIILINFAILCKVITVLVKLSGRSRAMKSFRSPAASFSSDKARTTKEEGSVNRLYLHRGSAADSPERYSTANMTKKGLPGTTYGSTTDQGQEEGVAGATPRLDSQSRFESRVPSQAYMYNRAQQRSLPASQPPVTEWNDFISDVKAAVKGAIVLLPILGIPWIFGMWAGQSYGLLIIFLIMNSTQGVAIFLVYCIMNGEVRRAMARHFRVLKMRGESGRSRTQSTSSLRSLYSKHWKRKHSADTSSSHSHRGAH